MRLLEPLAYHAALCRYLKENEAELWQWFSSAQSQADYSETLRLELLKNTYRLDPGSQPALFHQAAAVMERLELNVPLTIYQAQQSRELNAALYYIPGEAHVVLQGSIVSLLDAGELSSLLGHELAHYRLWQEQQGDYLTADRILQAMALDGRAERSHVQSARRYRLYTEIYADRGSLLATDSVGFVISSLIKMGTGLEQVSPESYLKQAEEVFAKSDPSATGLSHPETFIRARAIHLWNENSTAAEPEIQRMIEGRAALDELDVLDQQRLTALTRRLVTTYLQPAWFQTDATLGQARVYFPDFKPAGKTHTDETLIDELQFIDPKMQEYLCYVLLDFAVADADLDQVPLAAGYVMAGRLNVVPKWDEILQKELKLGKKERTRIQNEAESILEKTAANQGAGR